MPGPGRPAPERGITVVLTAILILALLTLISFVFNYAYARLIQRELQAAADAAADAGAASLCATNQCWDEAKAAAITIIKQQRIDNRLGDATTINLDPGAGPTWEDRRNNFRVTIERGRYVEPGIFTSLEPTDASRQVAPQVIANAVRVTIDRPELAYLVAPPSFRDGRYSVVAAATGLKGRTRVDCVAPFALHVCALMDHGEFSLGRLASADRLFMRTQRGITVPEFFYYPSSGGGGQTVVYDAPACKWQNPMFPDKRDLFGVIGIPESAGLLSEERVLEILDDTTHPCVSARLGERFQILHPGLTQPEVDDALWRQISTTYDTMDASHPAFDSMYGTTTVAQKLHDLTACQSTDQGFGACNSRRYVYNGVRGETYFPADRYASGFYPGGELRGSVWPQVDAGTPLWRVQIPVIASGAEASHLECPGGLQWVSPDSDYEIVGFVTANLYDTDIGWPPPVNPSLLPLPRPTAITDPVWGFAGGSTPAPGHPDCHVPGNGTACSPCNLVRGRIAGEPDFIATDQSEVSALHLVTADGNPTPESTPGAPTAEPTASVTPPASVPPTATATPTPVASPTPAPTPCPQWSGCILTDNTSAYSFTYSCFQYAYDSTGMPATITGYCCPSQCGLVPKGGQPYTGTCTGQYDMAYFTTTYPALDQNTCCPRSGMPGASWCW